MPRSGLVVSFCARLRFSCEVLGEPTNYGGGKNGSDHFDDFGRYPEREFDLRAITGLVSEPSGGVNDGRTVRLGPNRQTCPPSGPEYRPIRRRRRPGVTEARSIDAASFHGACSNPPQADSAADSPPP